MHSPKANLMSSQSFFCDISSSYLHTPPIQNSLPGREAINLLQQDDSAGEGRGCNRLPAVLTPPEHDTTRGGRRQAGGEAGRVDASQRGNLRDQTDVGEGRSFNTCRSLSGREAASALTGVSAPSSAAALNNLNHLIFQLCQPSNIT